jgi:hypothetical protein
MNFAPDEFAHRTASTVRKARSGSGSMRKGSFDDDKMDPDDLVNQAPMFFVSTLPVTGGGGAAIADEWPVRQGAAADVEAQQPVPF